MNAAGCPYPVREIGIGDTGILVAGMVAGALVFLLLPFRLEPELVAGLKGFARHGRDSQGAPEQTTTRPGSDLVPEQTGSR